MCRSSTVERAKEQDTEAPMGEMREEDTANLRERKTEKEVDDEKVLEGKPNHSSCPSFYGGRGNERGRITKFEFKKYRKSETIFYAGCSFYASFMDV